ncbi:MAG: hypothetical protein R3B82_15380 [Sandaracinaceae bacterium]
MRIGPCASALVALVTVLVVGAPLAHACVPEADALFASLPEAERAGLTLGGRGVTAQVTLVELDGAAPEEAVLAVDALVGPADGDAASHLFVLGCREGRWQHLGGVRLDIDDAWDGTLDERPGVRVVRAEAIPGVARSFLRVEHVDVRGGFDPRFVTQRLLLLTLSSDRVEVALDAVVDTASVSGPAREEGPTTRRVLRYEQGGAIALRELSISTRGRTRTVCRETLRFDGTRSVGGRWIVVAALRLLPPTLTLTPTLTPSPPPTQQQTPKQLQSPTTYRVHARGPPSGATPACHRCSAR